MSIDVQKMIEDAEKNLNLKLTDDQKRIAEGFGKLMINFWSNASTEEK